MPLFAVAVLLSALAGPASADAPDHLLQIPRDGAASGSAAGQLDAPRDIAGDPDSGHVFVSEYVNDRISEFTAWGEFVKAWGWDVSPEGTPGDTVEDQFEVCTAVCKAGVEGSEPGQLLNPTGLTVDGAGNIYVYDGGFFFSNRRVQKFSPAGEFLLMFGDGVNQGPTNPGDVCTAAHVAAGDICGPGTGGNEPAQLEGTLGNFIAYGAATSSIFVGDTDMIQEFDLDGTFKGLIPFEGALGAFDGNSVRALDADPASNLYIALEGLDDVHKLSAMGALLSPTFKVKSPVAIAVDIAGNVYSMPQNGFAPSAAHILGFTASGVPIDGMEPADGFASAATSVIDLIGLGTNLCPGSELPGNLYVSYFNFGQHASVNAYGTPPLGCEPAPANPPKVIEEYAISVDTEGAVVKAAIDPNLRNDTTFFVQYGTAGCMESGWTNGCEATAAAKLTESFTDLPLTTEGVFLDGLEPATTYHYRFVAQSGGGGPVFGAGNSFKTFAQQTPPTPGCPGSKHLRTGASSPLPDCRAYEMVSPLDKNNGDIIVPNNITGFPVSLRQSSLSGDGLAYSASRSFGNPKGAPFGSQYVAARDSQAGWVSEAISPSRTRQTGDVLDVEFKHFSADLCEAWLRHDSDPPLAPEAIPGYFNLYRFDHCGGGGYEALTREKPPNIPCLASKVPGEQCPDRYFPLELQGVSADSAKAVYVASDNLAGAPVNNNDRPQLYYWDGAQLRFACILPTGLPTSLACSAGTFGNDNGDGRLSSLHNAISAGGSVLYWSDGTNNAFSLEPGSMSPRQLYVREHPDRAQSPVVAGQCTEPEKACTYQVSGALSTLRSQFWAAADDGSQAIFTIEEGPLAGNLYEFELAKAKAGEVATTLIAEDVKGVMGASEDATHVYFASTEDLDGTGSALSGEPNLYLRAPGGSITFIAALAPDDLNARNDVSPVSRQPFRRAARVSPDGRYAAFTTAAAPTGYDNRDAASGERDAEVYHYDADADRLVCVSCNPSGARPSGREGLFDTPRIASRLPTWERSLYASRALSEDGQRLFFESFDALTSRDTNGQQDVYQWEASGKGDCDEADSSFSPASGGCVDLISSGQSPRESSFYDASPSGNDVFFSTLSSLVPQDYGLIDVYDARVGGGFPPLPRPNPPCEGEACQSPSARPERPVPSSSVFQGPGDVKPPVRKRRCPKGKRQDRKAGKARCAKRKAAKGNKREQRGERRAR